MIRSLCLLAMFLLVPGFTIGPTAQRPTSKTLEIYVVDVEGGNATLFVAPSGESLLVDTGNGGPQGQGPANAVRDAGRIMAAASDAGIHQIDQLITTHWHSDHFGGMAELASRIPIRHFIDHGANAPDDFAHASADEFPADVPPRMTLQTIPFNVTGNPTLALPTGFSRSGLPLGMQVVGRAFDEPTVFRIGAAYEAAAGWIHQRPSLASPVAA